jgi:hypothetical protein
LANEQATIKLRLDVDYPYSSRFKSFLYIALGIKKKTSKGYLKNAKTISKMINASPKQVTAYWFFTPYTIPDKKLLDLLNPGKHEVALHIANNPYKEWKILENETNRTVKYYTIHGTSRLIAQLLWRRKLGERQAKVPSDFPLKSLHDFPNYSLDVGRFELGLERAKGQAQKLIEQNCFLSIHPDWLFKAGPHKGPFYDILKWLLDVDVDLGTIQMRKRFFVKIAHDIQEYEKNIVPTSEFIEKLDGLGVDVYSFLERKWCCSLSNLPSSWVKTHDNVALLEIKKYDEWWNTVGKKTRNMVRRAEKSGVKVNVVQPNPKLAEGIWNIYNETPIRQERAFPHFGQSLQSVTDNMFAAQNSIFIGAFLEEELVGFIQLLRGDNIAIISQVLSLQKHWDKALNNALLAKTVEFCASNSMQWLMYGRIGNHPSLDKFKESNGFNKFSITRYYIPITRKGRVAIHLGLHREFKDAVPNFLKYPLIPVFNLISRTKMRLKHRK